MRLLKELVGFKTVTTSYANPPQDSRPLINFLEGVLKDLGFECKILEKIKGFPNLVAELDCEKRKTVCFVTHYDVVPASDDWKTDPFVAKKVGDKIYGRGTSDAKGGIVAFIEALKELKDSEFNVKFICVGDEEIGGKAGIHWLFTRKKKLVDADVFYVIDCGTEGVEIGCSSTISGKIRVFGKRGHSAYPFKFVNALEKTILLAQKLLEWKELEKKHVSKKARAPRNNISEFLWNRFSITMLHAGEKPNVIPGISDIIFNWRLIPDENVERRKQEFLKRIQAWKKEVGMKCKVEFLSVRQGYVMDENDEYVEMLRKIAVSYTHLTLPTTERV